MAARRKVERQRRGVLPAQVVTFDAGVYSPQAPASYTRLRTLAAERAELEGRIRVSVQELRLAGASWSVVGDALGVTRSAAQKRYGADELPLG